MDRSSPAPPTLQHRNSDGFKSLGQLTETRYQAVPTNEGQVTTPSYSDEKQWRRAGSPKNLVSRMLADWWAELLALVMVVLAFAGLVAVLRRYQNQPIPSWPAGFTLNAALSVFSILFRGPLLYIASRGIGQIKWQWFARRRPLSDLSTYDEASRGPLGAAKLLWTARWRHITAFLGALVTILAIAVEPFTQTVVSYYGCNTNATHVEASISRLNSFFHVDDVGKGLPTMTRVALTSSIGDATAILPNSTCSTESCVFQQPYHSIGLCSSCEDVTPQVVTSCNVESDDSSGGCNYTLPARFPTFVANISTSFLIAQDPRRDLASEGFADANWDIFTVHKYGNVMNSAGVMVEPGDPGTPSNVGSTIDFLSAEPLLGCRCLVYYCVRTYTATIDSGVLHETLQSTSSNWSSSNDSLVLGTVKVDCLSSQVQARLLADEHIVPDTEWMSWNGTYLNGTEVQEGISSSSNPAIPIACAYQAQPLSSILTPSAAEDFTDFLNGTLSAGGGNASALYITEGSPSTLVELYNNGSVSIASLSAALANLTTVASNYLRNNNTAIPRDLQPFVPSDISEQVASNPVQGQPSDWNHAAQGNATVSATCIQVRWSWLSVPVVLFLGGLVFLLSLIAQNALLEGPEVWKSSQEALIWHGLEGPAQSESARLNQVATMERRAKDLVVTLRKTSMGWKLVQESQPTITGP